MAEAFSPTCFFNLSLTVKLVPAEHHRGVVSQAMVGINIRLDQILAFGQGGTLTIPLLSYVPGLLKPAGTANR